MGTYDSPHEFEMKMYQLYELDWMMKNGYGLEDAFNVMRELQEHYQDADEEPTIQEGIQNFYDNKFHGKGPEPFRDFVARMKTDMPEMTELIQRSNDSEALTDAYQEFLDRTNPHIEVPYEMRSKESMEREFQEILTEMAKYIHKKTGAKLYRGGEVGFQVEPYDDDALPPKDIEQILSSNMPHPLLESIIYENFERDDLRPLEYEISKAAEHIATKHPSFLKSYISRFDSEEPTPKECLEQAFNSERNCGLEYQLEKSPVWNRKMHIDILYEPQASMNSEEQFAAPALVAFAKQQGVLRDFRKEVETYDDTQTLESEHSEDWSLGRSFAEENLKAKGDSKLTFLAEMSLKECVELREAQKDGDKGTITLPKTVVAGQYDFTGREDMGFYIGDFKRPVKLPLQDVKFHLDGAGDFKIRDYYPNKAWESNVTFEPEKGKGKRTEKSAR